jgi:NAD(P)-dependent dehydrogenase (short-subunit alcohol dehydrogenase family)
VPGHLLHSNSIDPAHSRRKRDAHAALFLPAPETAWTTGAVLHVDGGYAAH